MNYYCEKCGQESFDQWPYGDPKREAYTDEHPCTACRLHTLRAQARVNRMAQPDLNRMH